MELAEFKGILRFKIHGLNNHAQKEVIHDNNFLLSHFLWNIEA